ncbi:hypothetical protein C479_05663 [Halovivax asiaticus JCM 14624]|uniref:Uncharacterized protein n=1 Tax=Halovivax asiaticus JCM 14624 TaxID=1227490 RepID=M0BN26_9EURY|nr:hypothetical protein C479_05663 [Halovivax asiaticus JCM 14624]
MASEYAELKRDLAATYLNDRASYTPEKSAFVESILEDALDE